MTYREASVHSIEGDVTHGPFPVRLVALAFMALSFALAPIALLFASASDTLVCQAQGLGTPERAALCTLTQHRPPAHDTVVSFDRRELTEGNVRVDVVTGSKGHKTGIIVLHLARGDERALLSTGTNEADRVAAELGSALSTGKAIEVELHNARMVGLFGLGLLALGFWAAYSFFKVAGRFRLTVLRGGAALRVQRTLFGIPVGSHEVPLDGVADVHVLSTSINDFWTPKGMTTSMSRLALVNRAGTVTPLTARSFPGETLHYRAAASLRALLRLEPLPNGVEETLARIPLVVRPIGMRIGAAWAGLCLGSVLGPVVAFVFGRATQLMPYTRGGPADSNWIVGGAAMGAAVGVAIAVRMTRPKLPR
jgi:hypothetical protein